MIQTFYRKGVITLALDDTLFHRSGRKVDGAGTWRDAVRSTQKHIVYAWGLNLVVLTLQLRPPWDGEPLGLPINMRLHRKNGPCLIELAEQMINEVRHWFPDRWFRVVGATPSFADAIACLRRCLWRERIKYMFGNAAVHDKKFEFLLEALAPAA